MSPRSASSPMPYSFVSGLAAVLRYPQCSVRRQSGAVVDHHRRYLDVDALCDADLPRRPALDPGLYLRSSRSVDRASATGGSSGRSPCRWPCPSSCWRFFSAAIENFKMFDIGDAADRWRTRFGPPRLPRSRSSAQAFESWRKPDGRQPSPSSSSSRCLASLTSMSRRSTR